MPPRVVDFSGRRHHAPSCVCCTCTLPRPAPTGVQRPVSLWFVILCSAGFYFGESEIVLSCLPNSFASNLPKHTVKCLANIFEGDFFQVSYLLSLKIERPGDFKELSHGSPGLAQPRTGCMPLGKLLSTLSEPQFCSLKVGII